MVKTGLFLAFLFFSAQPATTVMDRELYDALSYTYSKPDFQVFSLALRGYRNLYQQEKIERDSIITLVDFTKSSAHRRLWVIDLKQQKVVYQSLVAHGKNTGNVFAKSFSNKKGSNQSSLGFYVTSETYIGKHGLSLFLDGMEPGVNDLARTRSVVMHGATYVSQEFITKYGRLGRSFGCPSVPMSKHKEIISYIKEGTCLFIYHNSEGYLQNSQLLEEGL